MTYFIQAPHYMKLSRLFTIGLLFPIMLTAQISQKQWLQDIDELVEKLEKIHPDLYRHISKAQFYLKVDELKNSLESNRVIETQFKIMNLVSLLRDRHTAVYPLDPNGFNHWIPISIYSLSDGFYVVAATDEYIELLGTKVISIGGIPIK